MFWATRSAGGSSSCSPRETVRQAISPRWFARSAPEGSRRIYSLDGERMTEVQTWVDEQLGFWSNRLDALDTELHRRVRTARGDTEEGP